MSGADLGRADRPEENIVFHRAALVVAEVTRSVEEKSEARHRRVARVARELGRLAEAGQALRASAEPTEVVSGARAARMLRTTGMLAHVMKALAPIVDELATDPTVSESLGEKRGATLASVREVIAWAVAYHDELAAIADEFGRMFAGDLKQDAERQRAVANEWSVVDADGIK